MDNLEQHLPQVRIIAASLHRRLPRNKVDLDDLIQAGSVGLCKAANTWDPERGVKFKTYASRRIYGEMLDMLREEDFMPRALRSKSNKAKQDAEAVVDTETAVAMRAGFDSIDAKDKDGFTLAQVLEWDGKSPADKVLHSELVEMVRNAISCLPARQATVLRLYYFHDLTGQVIADHLGCVESRVSQLKTKAHKHLYRELLPYAPPTRQLRAYRTNSTGL